VIWTFGPFEVDDDRCELRQDGQVIELRRKVFDVLHYLVRHSDRLVSKGELLQSVWQGETIHEGVIPQNITLLRKVLGDQRASAKIIQTVHGRGYRFVAKVVPHPARTPELAGARPPAAPGTPFVGRERVMEALRGSLDEALAGRGRLVILSGEAGIGKTRTSEELAAEARSRGARVLEGRCHEGEGAPVYWPWVQILRAAAGDGDHNRLHAQLGAAASDVAHLVSELRGHFGDARRATPVDWAQARFRLFDGITSFLSRLSRTQPLVLIFDDLHWADEATLHLLRFVSREVRSLPLLVLGTSRDLDAAGEAAAAGVLPGLVGGAHVQRIYLRGLSQADTSQLVLATVQGDPGESTLRELHALTDGNPFFVQEIVRLIVDSAAGGDDRDRWRLELPTRVREVIALRLSGLGPVAQRVLALASVIGREFDLAVLEQVAALPRAELMSALAAAADARIVREAGGATLEGGRDAVPSGRYRFAHALIRESLYGALNEPERVRLHEQVGLALEALFGVDAERHGAELAQHFYRAASGGDVERAVSYCMRAAEHALELLAFEEAVHHYRRALEALACRLPVDEQRRFELKLALGSALFRAGEDGNPTLLGAAEIARRLARPDLLGPVVLAMSGWPVSLRHGRTANSELYPLLAEALAAPLDDQPVLRARLLSLHALNCPPGTKVADRVALGSQALELARAVRHDEALHDALLARLQLTHNPEDTQRRLELAGELLAVAGRLGSKERIFTAHELRIQPLLALGDLAGADRELATCAQLAEELRLPRCRVQVLRYRLQRALGDGRFDDVLSLTEEAVRVRMRGQARRSPIYMITMFVWQMFVRAQRGERAWLEPHLQWMAADAHRAPLMRSHVAYLHALFGRLDEARSSYGPLFAPGALDDDRDDNWLTMLVLTADAVTACGDRAAAAELYPRLLPHAALNVAHLEMLVYFGCCAHWLGTLGALLGDPRAAEHFETALAMNERLGARPALARTSFEYARLLLDGGNAARGRELLAQAESLAAELGMADLLQSARRLAAEVG
jgi:DNA-binding winged helix-turn-helix (wHTH) protein